MNNANNHGGMGGPNNPGAGGNNNNSATLNSALMEPMSPEVIQAAKDVRYIAERASGNNQDDQVAADWTYIGLVLDSFTFWVTGLVIVGGTAYFLMSAPNSFGSVDQQDLIENWDANHCRIFFNGDYKLFSYATVDTVTIDTMKALCCEHFFSPQFADKTSKYSNETATTKEVAWMETICGVGEKQERKRREIGNGEDLVGDDNVEDDGQKIKEEKKRFVPGVRGGGGPLAIPASPEAHERRREEIRRKMEENASGESAGNRQGVNWEEKFRSMGLDFDTEWKNALKENLVLMRSGEGDMKRVEELAKRKPRGGLRHNATVVG